MRLKYADVDPVRIEVVPAIGEAVDRVASGASGSAYLLATYTAMLELRGVLEERGLVAPYWQEAA